MPASIHSFYLECDKHGRVSHRVIDETKVLCNMCILEAFEESPKEIIELKVTDAKTIRY